jgi:hypothetical protein
MNKTYTRMWRWSLLAVLILGGYWLGYFLIKGFVPPETVVGFWTNSLVIAKLNFGVPRWFDLAIGPIWLMPLIFWLGDPSSNSESGSHELTLLDWLEMISLVVVALGFLDAVFVGIVTGLVSTILSIIIAWIAVLSFYGFGRTIITIVNWANAK